jgi:hypothetical protein
MRCRRTQINQLLATVFLAGITLPARADNPVAKELQNKPTTEREYYQVQNEYAAMHQAVIKARKTIGKFGGGFHR